MFRAAVKKHTHKKKPRLFLLAADPATPFSFFLFLCFYSLSATFFVNRFVGLVVKANASRAEGPRFDSRFFATGFFRGPVIPMTSKLARQWLPCQAPGVTGSVLGLVGPVSVYCDWVWQHVNLSEQIRP